MSHSASAEMVPILGNDAKTQGKPNDLAKSHEPSKKSSKSRKPHLVLKKTKVSGGPGKGLKRIPKRSELVYLQPSPNYCEPDLAQGSLGTQGRYCNRTSKGKKKWYTWILIITFLFKKKKKKDFCARIVSLLPPPFWIFDRRFVEEIAFVHSCRS